MRRGCRGCRRRSWSHEWLGGPSSIPRGRTRLARPQQVIDLRPVYHRKEDRIRAHMVLCWLALLLVRLIETRCGGIWPQLRRELGRIAVGTFAGPVGVFRQRSEITKPLRDILARLHVDPPARICQLAPAEAGPARTLPLARYPPSIHTSASSVRQPPNPWTIALHQLRNPGPTVVPETTVLDIE